MLAIFASILDMEETIQHHGRSKKRDNKTNLKSKKIR